MMISKIPIFIYLGLLLCGLTFLATACQGEEITESSLPEIEGPALVMFYTDG